MPFKAVQQRIKGDRFREQRLLDRATFVVTERAVIDKNLRDGTVEEALRKRRLRRVIRIKTSAENHLVHRNARIGAFAFAALEPVEENLRANFPNFRANGENMKIGEGPLG